jgi:4-carboxymuconolactone decarboxylase
MALQSQEDRLPPLSEEQCSPKQLEVIRELLAGPRTKFRGPFVPLLRSPELLSRLQKVGEYLRFNNAIGFKHSEFAVLLVSRHWTQPIEWHIHHAIALEAGVNAETVESISQGRRPKTMTLEEAAIYDFIQELQNNQCVSDATWGTAKDLFGEQGVIDMIAHCGYYSLMAMVMNACRTALPEGVTSELTSFPC